MADPPTPRFLLDTNICVYLLGTGDPRLRSRIEQYAPGELATSAVAFAEVMVGAGRLNATLEALALFEIVKVFPFDEAAAMAYAGLPFRRGSYDRLIAAHAMSLGLPLVTNNLRDFVKIPGLKVENWVRP